MNVASSFHISTTPSQLISYQVPTPPPSKSSSPTLSACVPQSEVDIPGEVTILISQTFHPDSKLIPPQPDTVFRSSDNIFFYVHRAVIQEKSSNDWSNRLPYLPASTYPNEEGGMNQVIALPESAAVLNVLLHAIYNISCAPFSPSIHDLVSAVDAMETYGVPAKDVVLPSSALYGLILSNAPLAPLAAYTLAAQHDLHSLAVQTSTHLLSYRLMSLPETTAEQMGPLYLKRLFILHSARLGALKRLLLQPPQPHPPSQTCGSVEQTKLTHAWMLAAAQLAWEDRADLPSSAIEAALLPLGHQLSCPLCADRLAVRVRQVVADWAMVKRSI
ncbi:hypothetical protein L226DRAFT_401057 [Lentinus tigrinus ALCF2SS1-7]|uniref:uncharacterized protein n=1 Tax=Lentinus tigrinus ALCF2SS1-7 TaxID=1328758 RepID=UPI0011661C99|nr:hypothetical protein L226DRAFT_401057 [Lentinus tigrinus ALCF2SS1-7]